MVTAGGNLTIAEAPYGTMPTRYLALILLLAVSSVRAQSVPPPPSDVSPEVRSDRRVVFRFRAPNAREVLLAREGA